VAANDTATAAAPTIGGWADLGIEMTAPAKAGVGDTIDVNLKVTNNGPCTATDVAADDEQGLTALSLEFISADGDCTVDPLADTCSWPTLAPGEFKQWTLHYKVLPLATGLMQNGEPVTVTVFSTADAAFDYNSANDVAQTNTIVSRSVSGCSTGDMGGALSLLALALPFLKRRRKS
jgi:MYXO-CTERM domain-containing protein